MAKKIKALEGIEEPKKVSRKKGKTAKKAGKKAVVKLGKKAKKVSTKRGRRGVKRSKAVKVSRKVPTIMVVGSGAKAEPVWWQYAQKAPVKPSTRPSVPTDIRVGNLVGWKTDSGKDRIGIVREFIGDAARVGIGGKSEVIRIARLTKLAEKVKEE